MVRLVGESLGIGQHRLSGRGVCRTREHKKERLGAERELQPKSRVSRPGNPGEGFEPHCGMKKNRPTKNGNLRSKAMIVAGQIYSILYLFSHMVNSKQQ